LLDTEMPPNEDEIIACEFLKSLDMGAVQHEPDGNVTPDFLLDGRIAVEVRRLNQNYTLPGGRIEGFGNVAASAWQTMEKILRDFGPPAVAGECWNVLIQFRRPLNWKTLKPGVIAQLKRFQMSDPRGEVSFKFGENLQLDLLQTRRNLSQFFTLLGGGNAESGGNVMALVEENLRHCVAEKENKVARVRVRYNEWWLVLINRIDLNMEAEDYRNFGKDFNPPMQHHFGKIILVDPRGISNSYELQKSTADVPSSGNTTAR
jgi:hypothetical protein